MNHPRISAAQLFSAHTISPVILDVRTPPEVAANFIPGALHIPLHLLTPEKLEAELIRKDLHPETVYLLCQAGKRADMAADQLLGRIKPKLVVIEGGMNAIKAANIVTSGKGSQKLSLERQVQVAVGSIVLLAVILAALGSTIFFWLAALVGAGLIYAGLSNNCFMTKVLAKMPWNR